MICKVLRLLFGGYYFAVGIVFALTLLGMLQPPKLAISASSAAFQQALTSTGFVMPILIATYIAGGAALFFIRTTPLGLAILAPAVVMISLTDSILDTAYVVAVANLLVFLVLGWQVRAAYRPMWTFDPR